MDTKKPERIKGILVRKIGDECMLYDPDKGAVHVINSTAAFVWGLCNGSHTVEDIIGQMTVKFQVQEGSDIQLDIENVIEQFKEINVIR